MRKDIQGLQFEISNDYNWYTKRFIYKQVLVLIVA